MSEKWRDDWNPFRIVEKSGEPAYASEDSRELPSMPASAVKTVVCVTEDDDDGGVLSGNSMLEFTGLWWPRKGELLLLADPNRPAVVVGVQAQLEPSGFTAFVYVKDPGLTK
jgi:hypothetical protein